MTSHQGDKNTAQQNRKLLLCHMESKQAITISYLCLVRICLCLLLLLPSFCTLAQGQDSVVHKKIYQTDSLLKKSTTKADSIATKLNSVKAPRLNTDSLSVLNSLDSTKRIWLAKLDSAKQYGLPTANINKTLDSLVQRSPYRYVDSVQQKMDKLKQRITDPVQKAETTVNNKLNFIKSESGEGAVLPNNVDLTSTLPSVTKPLAGVPDVNVSSVNLPTGNMELPEIETKLPTPDLNIGKDVKLPAVDQLKVATEKLDQVGAITEKAGAYQEEISAIKENGLASSKEIPKLAEQKIGELDEVSAIQNQAGKMDLPIGEKMDEEAAKAMLKEQAQTEVMKTAKDHFAGKQEALMSGMQKMTDLKKTYESLDSLNVPKRRPNAMKGKSLLERLVPGFSLQIQKSSYWLLDLNPSLAYRISGRWSAGFGWNQRIGFTKQVNTVEQEKIYGPRVFTEFLWAKGFSLRLEGEQMFGVSVPSFSTPKSADEPLVWMTTVFAGIKKEYKISNRLRGNIQILYMIYDDQYSSPYAIKFNTRLGLEYVFKGKR